MKKFAVIDVGSNSVRLMFVADGKVLYKTLRTTRLGEGLANAPVLLPQAMERTAQAIADFYHRAKAENAEEVFAFATAAVRSAENKFAFLDGVQRLCGLKLEVVSGEEEAELGILGALGNSDGAVIDLGGASTEIVVKKDGALVYKKSLNIGVVRLKDRYENRWEEIKTVAKTSAKEYGVIPKTERFYGIGGTATTLAAQILGLQTYVSEKITGTEILVEELKQLAERFSKMSVEEIAALPCMPQGRADVIMGGTVFLSTLLEELGVDRLTVSDRDNLEGYAIKRGLMK